MTTLRVPDMTCAHCKASVESALAAVPETGVVSVDLIGKLVHVSGAVPPDGLIDALAQAGFPASVMTA